MNKQIIPIILVLLISFASAESICAGDNYSFLVNTTDNLSFDVIGNTSSIDGLSITQEVINSNSNITISTVPNFKPDNFTIILTSIKTKEVIKEIHSGSKTIYKNNTIYLNNTIEIIKEKPCNSTCANCNNSSYWDNGLGQEKQESWIVKFWNKILSLFRRLFKGETK